MGDRDVGITRNGGWSGGSCAGRSVIIGWVGSNGGFLFHFMWEGTGFRDGGRVLKTSIERLSLCLFFAAVPRGERCEESRHSGAVRAAQKGGIRV